MLPSLSCQCRNSQGRMRPVVLEPMTTRLAAQHSHELRYGPVTIIEDPSDGPEPRTLAPVPRAGQSHHLHVALEATAARRMAQLAKRLGFDLPYPLAGDVEGGAHFFQRARAPVVREA